MIRRTALLALATLLVPAPVVAQEVLERTPAMDGGWVGVPWTLHVLLPHRFANASSETGIDLGRTTTFTGALGLPWRSAAGLAYATSSPTVPGEPDEIEAFLRHRFLDGDLAFADVALTAAWNSAAESLDAELSLARQVGPLRLLAAGRWFSDYRALDDDRLALAAGAVWHPFPRSAPIALAGDVAAPLDRAEAEEVAWSAGLQVGIPHTALTLSLHATNTAATTLQGATAGGDRVRFGFEATAPIPVGFFFGLYPAREAARESVSEAPGAAADAVVEVRRYAFGPERVVVEAGAVVEWVNRDAVVHTATAEDDAWDSGAIPPGESWRARFERPGIYPYYCGPHPFMKGVVIVR